MTTTTLKGKKLLSILMLLVFIFTTVIAAPVIAIPSAPPSTLTLDVTYRDFHGRNWGNPGRDGYNGHPDFEWHLGDDRNIVTSTLGSDGKPVYAGTGPTTTTNNQTFFDMWYNNNSSYNEAVEDTLVFTRKGDGTPGNPYLYEFSDSTFFPLDGRGFDADLSPSKRENRSHNYHFTMELHTSFTYLGGETFSFTGDDDIWVYINNQRVIDLGGVHTQESASVSLDTLGLTTGQDYAFDLFFAERHTVDSTFKATTNILLKPDPVTTYTVTFDSQGGTPTPDPIADIPSGGNVGSLPTEPDKDDHTFGGWFTEPDGAGTPFTAETAVASDMTVYAYWIENPPPTTYTVTFDSQGGAPTPDPIANIPSGGNVGSLPTEPDKDDHTFGGWFTEPDGAGTPFTAETAVAGDLIVYACWIPITPPGPTTGNLTITKVITGDEPFEDATFTFTVEGQPGTYSITGEGSTTLTGLPEGVYTITEIDLPSHYSIGDYDEDVTIAAGQTATVTFTNRYTTPSTGNLTITKIITGDEPPQDATFTFTVEGQPGTYTITGEGSTTLTDIPTGVYTVTEIDLPNHYSIGDYDDDVTILGGQTAEVTFANRYTEPVTPTYYTVTFDPGEYGDFDPVVYIELEAGDPTPDAPESTPGKSGWTFLGWSPARSETVEGTITYYAQWQYNETPTYYTVTYDPGDHGTFGLVVYSGLEAGDPTPDAPEATPGESGWTFLGWSPARSETVEGTITYYAQWQYNETPTYYTVTFDPGEYGDFDPVVFSSLPYGVDTPSAPEVEDGFVYLFKGWSPTIADTVTGDATYVAQWKRRISSGGGGYTQDEVPEVIIEETPAPEAPIVIIPAPEEVIEEIIIVEEAAPLGELPKTGTGPLCPAPAQAAAYLPEALDLSFKDEDQDEIV